MKIYTEETEKLAIAIGADREPTDVEWERLFKVVGRKRIKHSIWKWISCHIFHTVDSWGTKYDRPLKLFKFRFIVGGQTYYRDFWVGLKSWWRYGLGQNKIKKGN